MNPEIHNKYRPKGNLLVVIITAFLLCFAQTFKAQEPPPRPITVTVTQNLAFGAFTHGAVGGTVIMNADASRNATGDVILLNLGYFYSSAIYQIVANPGTIVTILNGPDVSLAGSSGGSMILHIGASSPASPFVTNAIPPLSTPLNIGGTLTVGNSAANPPGNYNGTFAVTFVQQ